MKKQDNVPKNTPKKPPVKPTKNWEKSSTGLFQKNSIRGVEDIKFPRGIKERACGISRGTMIKVKSWGISVIGFAGFWSWNFRGVSYHTILWNFQEWSLVFFGVFLKWQMGYSRKKSNLGGWRGPGHGISRGTEERKCGNYWGQLKKKWNFQGCWP